MTSFTSKFECKTTIHKSVLESSSTSLIGAIDQGTSSTRFILFTSNDGSIAASAQMEHTQIFPPDQVGWHEHDPIEIWNSTLTCMQNVIQAVMEAMEWTKEDIGKILKSIGITNQRETTIAWNASTGKPYYNAVVWDDLRTTETASVIANGNVDKLREKTGLPLASYFAGTKVRWLIDNVPTLRQDLINDSAKDQVRFGTIDTWLVYQLTGEKSSLQGVANCGGLFLTDVSNASRWLFMNLHTMDWDQFLIDQVTGGSGVELPYKTALPEIKPSSLVYGACHEGFGLEELSGIPIAGILGDQQAALFGQGAFEPGEAKNTYGTGLFLMMNTGTDMMPSTHGLLTTVGYKLGDGETVYALEGSVSHSGSTIQWLRDQLQIISDAAESETLASQVSSNDGLYFVPAFAGLFAPYWRSDARACIMGMTASHTRNHIARAALEACAYQTKDVFDAMYADSKVSLTELRVDGGGTANKLLMQFQSDIINVPVVKPVINETTSLGAAFVAGLAVGVWSDVSELKALWKEDERFTPEMEVADREKNWAGWKKAITKSMGWVDEN